MIKKIGIILMFFMVQNAFADSLDKLVPASSSQLRQGTDPIVEAQLKNASFKLLPADDNLQKVVNDVMKSLGSPILVETLYLYKKPEAAKTSASTWDNTQKTGIYNQLLAISSLEGIQYYSASRGAMRTFYEISYVIDSPNNKNKLPDPVHQAPPASLQLYARQKDLTFGDNVYKYSYTITENCIYFIQENMTSLTYGLLPVISKNNLKTVLAVFDCGDSLLIYVASMAKGSSAPGMGDRIGNSFSNRAQAVLSWFSGRADVFFKK